MKVRELLFAWAVMMGLLALTIAVSFVSLGPFLPLISYSVAAGKAGLIVWFFMEMRSEEGPQSLVLLFGLVWLIMLFLLLAADVVTRSAPG
jgi:cytochrome c oxidase subunit 4